MNAGNEIRAKGTPRLPGVGLEPTGPGNRPAPETIEDGPTALRRSTHKGVPQAPGG